MWTICIYLIPVLSLGATENQILYSNGWIPIDSATIYKQIHRQIQEPPLNTAHNIHIIYRDNNVVIPSNEMNYQEKVIADYSYPFDGKVKCYSEDARGCFNHKTENFQSTDIKVDFVPDIIHFEPQNETNDKTARRSKKLASNMYDNTKNFLYKGKSNVKDNGYKNNWRIDDFIPKPLNNYEVTEDTVFEDLLAPEENNTKHDGYKYEPPEKQNSTSELFKILSKYKIKEDDVLPNYALSLKQKTQIPLKNAQDIGPYPTHIPKRYNNLNHLSVDPMLAVLLSNYGFYLRGLYGINNNYNNLYGYLASNNIHNNRPFGAYKIFSDTDSSH